MAYYLYHLYLSLVATPGFPRRGGDNLLFVNYMKMKEIGQRGVASPGSANKFTVTFLESKICVLVFILSRVLDIEFGEW